MGAVERIFPWPMVAAGAVSIAVIVAILVEVAAVATIPVAILTAVGAIAMFAAGVTLTLTTAFASMRQATTEIRRSGRGILASGCAVFA